MLTRDVLLSICDFQFAAASTVVSRRGS